METTTNPEAEMKRQNTYVMYVDGSKTEYSVKGTSPAKAVREMVEAAGMTMASQDGRYGKTTDGHSVAAMTAPWGRVDSPDARTTRV